MSKQTEDTMMEIYMELDSNHELRKLWRKQMKKMESQPKHKWKTVAEQWEYALQKVKEQYARTNRRTKRKSRKNSTK